MLRNLQPLYDKVIVEIIKPEEQTASGIFLAPEVEEKSQWAKVIAVGTGRLTVNGDLIPLTVKLDDTVYFGKYAGSEADGDVLILKEDEILGYIRD